MRLRLDNKSKMAIIEVNGITQGFNLTDIKTIGKLGEIIKSLEKLG